MQLMSAGGAASPQGEAHIVTCPAQQAQKLTSALSGLEAIEVVLGFLEVVDSGRLYYCAVGFPFPVFLLAFWPPCCTRRISVDVVGSNLVDTMQVHATLLEQVLTPWLIACVLVTAHVIQRCLAIIKVCHVCGCSIMADNCKAAEK